jgi:hypothetical protein
MGVALTGLSTAAQTVIYVIPNSAARMAGSICSTVDGPVGRFFPELKPRHLVGASFYRPTGLAGPSATMTPSGAQSLLVVSKRTHAAPVGWADPCTSLL